MTDVETANKVANPHAKQHSLFFRDVYDPTLPPNHPINAFSASKKFGILVTLSFAGFLANYSAAAMQTAFGPMGESLGVSPPTIPTAIGYNLLGIAVGPLIWNPLSRTIGRRPTFLIGSAAFIPCVIWMALSKTFPVFCVARVFAGLCSAWSQTIPPAAIADIFAPSIRGSKMSVFGVSVIVAPVVAPLICSSVIATGYTWPIIFWIVLGFSALQFLMFFFLVPETLWITTSDHHQGSVTASSGPSAADETSDEKEEEGGQTALGPALTNFTTYNTVGDQVTVSHTGHVGAAWMPWKHPGRFMGLVVAPVGMLRFVNISLISIYYGMCFAWSVGITIVMPQLFAAPPYSFSEMALGCAFLAFGLGAVLGKWSGGIVGDKIVSYVTKKKSVDGVRQPEYRLWALLPILPIFLVAAMMVGAAAEKQLHWAVFLVGGGLFFFGMSASTGILQTYVAESYLSRTMDAQFVFIFFKCIWGFAIAFFCYEWGLETSWLEAYGIQAALATGLGFILCLALIFKGEALRRAQGMPMAGH